LPSLDGELISLADLRSRGLPVLLMFSDPSCASCGAMLSEAGDWQRNQDRPLTIALISRGNVDQNLANTEEHGLVDVLLQRDREAAHAYECYETPGAVLISTDGRIASPLTLGPVAISALVESASTRIAGDILSPPVGVGNGRELRANGLQVGEKVPEFTWKDLDQRSIVLRELRGTPVSLIFWNPTCGFCQQLAREFKAWRKSTNDGNHHVIVISSGSMAENNQLELGHPIVLEDGFLTGSVFGITGTPSGVAIDGNGRVATQSAIGGAQLLEMLQMQSNSLAAA
jgi:peroxiredoxin